MWRTRTAAVARTCHRCSNQGSERAAHVANFPNLGSPPVTAAPSQRAKGALSHICQFDVLQDISTYLEAYLVLQTKLGLFIQGQKCIYVISASAFRDREVPQAP